MKDENSENGGFRAGPSTVEGRCGTGEMKGEFSILVTDRNGRVREFLQRELCEEGYRVRTVRDGRELLRMLEEETRFDLLVLDVEIPYADGSAILDQIRRKRSDLAVIIHIHALDSPGAIQEGTPSVAVVEKSPDTAGLKKTIRQMLECLHPRSSASDQP